MMLYSRSALLRRYALVLLVGIALGVMIGLLTALVIEMQVLNVDMIVPGASNVGLLL